MNIPPDRHIQKFYAFTWQSSVKTIKKIALKAEISTFPRSGHLNFALTIWVKTNPEGQGFAQKSMIKPIYRFFF
jgi:hypothetical protein